MQRRDLILAAACLVTRPAGAESPEVSWARGVRDRTGNTPALERLGLWLQAGTRPGRNAPSDRMESLLRHLVESQEPDGYLGVYGAADRLGASTRGVDEYWGTAELGRGLLELATRGGRRASTLAERLAEKLIQVPPERLDVHPGDQHPSAAALLYFLTGVATRTGKDPYRKYLGQIPGMIGLPSGKSPFRPSLPPVLPEWTRDSLRNPRGTAALSGILALARYQGHALLAAAVREHWTTLRATLPRQLDPDLRVRWQRLTQDLVGVGEATELQAELTRLRALPPPVEEPYRTWDTAHRT